MGDLDLHKGLLYVRRSRTRVRNGKESVVRDVPLKTKHSRRSLDLSPTVVQAFLQHPAGDDPERDYVFRSRAGGPVDSDNLDRTFKRHLTLAGLPEIRFHDLRHTHAGLLIAAGIHPKAIQARLGHASITATLNIYGHLMPAAFKGVGERLNVLIFGTRTAPDENAGPGLKAGTRVTIGGRWRI
ncbi:MAG: site-specific integrase [Armatimonadetes bacterium]|nr:site-specific integrase [Armatimonadota bacterium]